jgi:hypothetical protein
MTEPRSVPPTSDELQKRRSESERRSITEWIAVARGHLKAAREKR